MLGGIGIPTLSVAEADKTLAQVRQPQLPHGEMKRGKISNSKINAYDPTVKQKGAAPQCHPFVLGWFQSGWDQNLNTTVPLTVRGAPIWTKPGEP